MRVIQVHNRYRFWLGGEDTVVDQERRLLSERGHIVETFFSTNADLPTGSPWESISTGFRSIWSHKAYREMISKIEIFHPDLIHIHNTFASLSPSVIWAAKHKKVPVVLTLHNYRLICATSKLFRDGMPCELCVDKLFWPALIHRCRYSGSFATGFSIIATKVIHRCLGTYRKKVDAFIVLSDFDARIMIRSGLPSERVFVKPNFLNYHPKLSNMECEEKERRIIFVGQAIQGKGVDLLLSAWSRTEHRGYSLLIVGNSQEQKELLCQGSGEDGIYWAGHQEREEVLRLIFGSRFLVLPSRFYEGMPMVIIEALSLGIPVIVPDHGVFPFMVRESKGALFFRANDAGSLSDALQRAIEMDEGNWSQFSRAAWHTFESRYTAETNYKRLVEIYQYVSGLCT